MPNAITARLADRLGARQDQLLAAADDAADTVDRTILDLWNQLMALIQQPGHWHGRIAPARLILQGMLSLSARSIHGSLTQLVKDGHDSAADVLVTTLPVEVLSAAGKKQFRGRGTLQFRPGWKASNHLRPHQEARGEEGHSGLRLPMPLSHLREDESAGRTQRGAVAITRAGASLTPAFGRIAEPVSGLTSGEQREMLRQTLFPAPSPAKIQAILRQPIHGSTWAQDLTAASRIAGFDPERMVAMIAGGLSSGQTPSQIAKTLLPVVSNVKSSARRIARTYGVQVANAIQRDTHEQLGDMLVGYMVNAQLDQNTRPWHRSRDGTIYYKNPGPGQKGYAQMPHPPLEAEDPRERPSGAPKTAWN